MSSNPIPFESSHGQLAPVNPDAPRDELALKRREEKINAPRLSAYLNKTLDSIAALDSNENRKIHETMTRCVAYYDGRSDGQYKNGTWVDNAKVDGEILPQDNDYKKQIDKLNMEMCRARIGYNIEPIDKSDPAKREAAEFARRRIEVNQNRIETEEFLQAENLSLLLKTWTLRYTFFDSTAESPEKSVELQAMKAMVGGASVTVCRTCQMQMAAVPCPNCGDTESVTIDTPPTEQLQTAQQVVSKGRVVTVRPDATMVQLDLNARGIRSSSFLRWRVVMRRCDWEAMYPNTLIPSGEESDQGRWKTEAETHASNSGWPTATEDATGGDQFEKIEGELVWLDANVYRRYASKEDERLGDEILAAGEHLFDKFPNGCCIARIGRKILDIHPSDKNIRWTMCVYGLREHALHGSGTTALLGPQDTIDDLNAFVVGHIYQSAAGREFARSGAIEGGKLPNINQLGIINNAPEEVQDITRWAIGRTQPQALTGEVYAFREAMRGSLQDAAGTSSLSMQGAADMRALGTATGIEAARDQAVGRIIPNRKLQAYMGAEWARQVLMLERENYDVETFLPLADKPNEQGRIEFTERGVRTFFETDLTDYLISPLEGSWVPTTPAQVKANATEFATVSRMLRDRQGGADKELLSIVAPAYNIPYNADEWGADQRAASLRLEEYARVSNGLAQEVPPIPEAADIVLANCAPWAQVDAAMDRHSAFRDFYQDWWQSDSARNSSPLLRLVVQRVYELHAEGLVAQQQDAGQAAIDAQAPQMAQQQEQAAQMQAQSQQQQVQNAIGEQLLTERDRLHQAEVDAAMAPLEQSDTPPN